MAAKLAKARRCIVLIYRWINSFIFWTPGFERQLFLTKHSETIYKRFRQNTFLFSQLSRLFVVVGLLNLSLLLYSVIARNDERVVSGCSKYMGPLVHSVSLAFHVLCFFLQFFFLRVFRRCHVLVEILSFICLTVSTTWAIHCQVVANFGLVDISFAAFRILVATIYFQYSTVLIILISAFQTLGPFILLNTNASSHPIEEVRGIYIAWNSCAHDAVSLSSSLLGNCSSLTWHVSV